MAATVFLITCEHGGNQIPEPYRPLFDGFEALLETHRGYDPGALLMANELADAFRATLVTANVSRLLVDLNRSVGHPKLFSDATRGLSPPQRKILLAQHYHPYRQQVEAFVRNAIQDGQRVIHISSHSFTPELDGQCRQADVGLLYDPARALETALCAQWKAAIHALQPPLRVHRNYPYIGKGDGLTSHLRRQFSATEYVGIELEINQAIVFAAGSRWTGLRRLLIDSLRAAN